MCDEGYQPNVSSNVTFSISRVCRDDGTWSGTSLACGEQYTLYLIVICILHCYVDGDMYYTHLRVYNTLLV